MSPEHLLGGAVDARSDLYSVGMVLYECLTGRLPFEVETPTFGLIVKLLEELPPPLTFNRDIPPAFSALVLRLLALRPDDRLNSALELSEQLAQMA